jgi:hypothetical protein
MPEDFISFCESLWQDWLADRLDISPFVRRTFDLDAAPEPYVIFESGQKPLYELLTNPGYTMGHQRRATVQDGCGPLNPAMRYSEAAERLGPFYEEKLAHEPAGHRIRAIKSLAALVGTEGVVQLDVCPFHSSSLPSKGKEWLMRESRTLYKESGAEFEVRTSGDPRPLIPLVRSAVHQVDSNSLIANVKCAWQTHFSSLRPTRSPSMERKRLQSLSDSC